MTDPLLDLADLPATWAPGQHAVFLQRYPAGRRVVIRLEVAGPPGRDGTPLLALTREGEVDLEMLWVVDPASDPPRVTMRRVNATRGTKEDEAAAEHAALVEGLVTDALTGGRLASELPRAACDARRFGADQAVVHEAPVGMDGRVRYLLSPRCAVLGVLQTQAFSDGESLTGDAGREPPTSSSAARVEATRGHPSILGDRLAAGGPRVDPAGSSTNEPRTSTGKVVAGLQLLAQGWGERPGSALALDDLRRVDQGGFTVETPRAWLPRRRGVELPGRFEPLYTAAWFLKEGGPGQALEGSLAHYTGEPKAVDARAAYVSEQAAEAAKKRGARGLERREVTTPHVGTITRYRAKAGDLVVEASLVRPDRRVLAHVELTLAVDPVTPGATDLEKAYVKVAHRLVDTLRFAPPG